MYYTVSVTLFIRAIRCQWLQIKQIKIENVVWKGTKQPQQLMKKSKHGYQLGDVLLEMRDYDSDNVQYFQIEANLCRIIFYCLCTYVLPLETQFLNRETFEIPLICLTHNIMCSSHKPVPGFRSAYVGVFFFAFNDMR